MTHEEVYKKFLIEYDKAIFTSSYPSLTKYESAVLLDKAYLALIAQKITGNNPRQAFFESDTKAIEDIRPLLCTETKPVYSYHPKNGATNVFMVELPKDMLYYVDGTTHLYYVEAVKGRDEVKDRIFPITLVSHAVARNFFSTGVNMPWVKTPVAYMEKDMLYIVYDAYTQNYKKGDPHDVSITYIKEPNKFVESNFDNTEIEINDSMVEELINLAIILGGEIVESPRAATKSQLRPLEA